MCLQDKSKQLPASFFHTTLLLFSQINGYAVSSQETTVLGLFYERSESNAPHFFFSGNNEDRIMKFCTLAV
uniref:Uncharacterized protein n=1 Tax=Arion vulgaris TaxID=1028688 RepID=A0A0B7B641_9EUPU